MESSFTFIYLKTLKCYFAMVYKTQGRCLKPRRRYFPCPLLTDEFRARKAHCDTTKRYFFPHLNQSESQMQRYRLPMSIHNSLQMSLKQQAPICLFLLRHKVWHMPSRWITVSFSYLSMRLLQKSLVKSSSVMRFP